MVSTALADLLKTGTHGARPAANAVAGGTLYACSTHSLIYQSDGASWSTWATFSSGLSDPMTTRGDIIVRDASNVTARLARGSAGQVLTSDGTDVAWATPSGSSDPTIPSGGSLYPGLSTSGWSSFGTPTTFDADTTVPGHFYLAKTSTGGNNIYGATRSTSSLPRTYTCKVSDWTAQANYQGCGLVLGDNAGKLMSWGAIFDANDLYLQRYGWNSASSAGSNSNYLSGTNLRPGNRLPLFLRLDVNSTSDVDLQYSRGGYRWYELATAVNPGFTIDRFGMFVYGFGASLADAAFDWIHES